MPPAERSPAHSGNENGTVLIRGIGLQSAVALNMIDMIGVGPFITIPLIVAAMGGPQAMLGWVAGAILAMCDGLIWAELAAAIPGTGGSYRYLKEIYNPRTAGTLFSFLFLWQLSFSAPLSIASGCVGLAQYTTYLWPSLAVPIFHTSLSAPLPLIGPLNANLECTGATFLAMAACITAVMILYRKITVVTKITNFLWVGVFLTVLWIIVTGIVHYDRNLAFSFPAGAFTLSTNFFNGLGAGMLVAVYDYWGYYNICFLGGEVRRPELTIPRAIIISIALVAILYLTMNLSILGAIPWQEIIASTHSDSYRFIISVFMERFYGSTGGIIVTVLIMWTAFASVCSLLLGYSRVPYAAAKEGDYFSIFGNIHPKNHFPTVSLLLLGGVALLFCFLRLADIIAALVVIRILIQFIAQTIGLIVYRFNRPEVNRPFKVWLYPLPAFVSLAGFFYILIMRKNFLQEIRYAILLIIAGGVIYSWRAWRGGKWPFGDVNSKVKM